MNSPRTAIRRVMVLNAKGGCGKTTIATNLAHQFAKLGRKTVLIDYDSQGSSSHWLTQRPVDAPHIHGIAAYQNPANMTRSWQMRIPQGTDCVVIDTPGAVEGLTLFDLVQQADTILVPVLPSPTDMHAVEGFLEALVTRGKARTQGVRIGLVANRLRANTLEVNDLAEFLERLSYPVVGEFRETQNYTKAAGAGIGIQDLPHSRVEKDLKQWRELMRWVENTSDDRLDESPEPQHRWTIAAAGR